MERGSRGRGTAWEIWLRVIVKKKKKKSLSISLCQNVRNVGIFAPKIFLESHRSKEFWSGLDFQVVFTCPSKDD